MIFLWSRRNKEHIAVHDVAPEEAEEVVGNAEPPFPEPTGEERYVVWGRTQNARFLQVLFVYVRLEDVEADEYERLELYEKLTLEEGDEAVRVIHARDLTDIERWRLRRRRRGRR